ncbi:ATP-binding protein [Desulfococcaceae bacterium HSG9]|nr:ATP-binding protein [Desulfococcaceae bacterium HSG9]
MKLFRSTKYRFYLTTGLLLIFFCGGYIQLALFFNRLAERFENRRTAFDNISTDLMPQPNVTRGGAKNTFLQGISTDADLLRRAQPWLFLSFSAALTMLFFILYIVSRKIITPIMQMSKVVMQVKSGNDQARFESVEKDEIAEFGFAFNEILDTINEHRHRLETQMKESSTEVLQTNEELILEIVERKQAEEDAEEALREAEAANQAKSTFLANMSHELRTPLNAILGYAQILQRETYVNEHQRDGLNIIQKSGQHLLMLLNDILDLSKIEVGRMEIQPTEFHLEYFLNNIVDIFRLRSEQKMIRFNCAFASDLPTAIRGDEIRLRQVLINLLGNAVKFTEKGFVAFKAIISPRQDVKYTMKNSGADVCIRFQIQDTGIGIAPEDLKTIFEPFQQVTSKREHTQGTGLGLAISKKLIEMMGGSLEVESDVSHGSLFIADVAFSIADSPATAPKTQTHFITGYTCPRRNVLIADDNPENRSVLRYLLTPLKFKVVEACNGQEAVEKMLTLHPDIILMDMVMPIADGFQAVRKIRSYESRMRQSPSSATLFPAHTPIIAITAKAFINDKQKCFDAGCDDFIPKPVNVDELLEKLQKLLSLEWLYKDTQSGTDESENTVSSPEPPDAEDLKTLIQLANVGDIRSIRNFTAKLEQSKQHLRPFAAQLNMLAQQFQIDKIRKLLNYYKGD